MGGEPEEEGGKGVRGSERGKLVFRSFKVKFENKLYP